LNWRRSNENCYPRYEAVSSDFEGYFSRLDEYFIERFSQSLSVNQAEVTYINVIPVDSYSSAAKWLSIFGKVVCDIENINISFNEVIYDEEGNSIARLNHEVVSVISNADGRKALRLTLTYRGVPSGSGIEEGMVFVRKGREHIVTRFSEMVTDFADKEWGKK
jgi:uncharacterized protein (TIGR04255 family)